MSCVGESYNRGNRAVGSYSARSVPRPHFDGPTAIRGGRPGIGTESLRFAYAIGANAVRRHGRTMRVGGDRC
ncbi:hypothetical protein DF029_25385 [Burkholderia cepacia]|nr:hypothetical protein DF043_15100 [Burkholderia cepacia]RQT67791.1 hypothetical protein DF029_25385 [Burkholderia cepacia]